MTYDILPVKQSNYLAIKSYPRLIQSHPETLLYISEGKKNVGLVKTDYRCTVTT